MKMKKYARIEDGNVVEFFHTADSIEGLFHPSFVWVDVTQTEPSPGEGWTFDGEQFMPPPPPSAEEVLAQVTASRAALMAAATASIAPLQDAEDLEIASQQEIDLLLRWKRYRIDLMRLHEQPGFPLQFEWPSAPA